ncbi:MAG: hypothetical protein HY713_14830 [candidate division NC10 bacterium]|nr:hypothetical protein [candidate division NC10 bacterium]
MPMRILVTLATLLFALAPFVGAAEPPGELRVAIPWTPENLDPTMNLSSIRAQVGVSLFDSLVGRDAQNRIVPELAESWKLLDDNTWQFRLRKGVVFHNGEPFNAEAVRFTVQRVLDPNQKSPNRANIAEIVKVEVVDDSTVKLVTRQPYAPLVEDATWVFLMQQVDIYAMRDRVEWTPRPDQWMPFQGATLKQERNRGQSARSSRNTNAAAEGTPASCPFIARQLTCQLGPVLLWHPQDPAVTARRDGSFPAPVPHRPT